MTKTITAIYRTADVAETVRAEIERLGVPSRHLHVVGGADRASEINALNLPYDDAVVYKKAVQENHYVVSADVEEDMLDATAEIMRHPENGVDIDAYEADYRSDSAYDADLGAYGEEEKIALAEERIAIGKRDVARGTAHVRTYVQEVPVEERVRLRDERIAISRQHVADRVVTGAEADALFQERDIAVTERSEEAVVTKEAVVTEEVVVGKEVTEREEVVRDTVRKTEVDIDRT